MKYKILFLIAFGVIATLIIPQASFALSQEAEIQSYRQNVIAYRVNVAFVDTRPHYGAFFTGSDGRNQHYLGPGGDAATCSSGSGCISTWHWWGPATSTLLVDFSWYWSHSDHRNKNNYQANMLFN